MKRNRRAYSLSIPQWIGVGLIGASFVGLIVIGGAIASIKHIRRSHPTKAVEYDFHGQWSLLKKAGAFSLISPLVGWLLYKWGERRKRHAGSHRPAQKLPLRK